SPSAGTLISTAITLSSADRERAVDQVRLLLEMIAGRAGRRRRRFGPADIDRPLRLHVDVRQRTFDAAVDEVPGAHVLWLLLAPHDLGIGIGREAHAEAGEGKRIELLDADDGDVVDLALAPLGEEIEIDLAAAQQHASHPVA